MGDGLLGAMHPLIGKKAAIKVMQPDALADADRGRALRPGGARGQPDRPPEHRRHLRLRRAARRAQLLRDGVAAGRDAARRGSAQRRAAARRGARHPATRCATRSRRRTTRASSTAISSRTTSSSSARGRRDAGQAARLRHRQARSADGGAAWREHATTGRGHGHARLHVARAGARQARRSPHRHLLARRDGLRDAARPAAVHRRQRDGDGGDAPTDRRRRRAAVGGHSDAGRDLLLGMLDKMPTTAPAWGASANIWPMCASSSCRA